MRLIHIAYASVVVGAVPAIATAAAVIAAGLGWSGLVRDLRHPVELFVENEWKLLSTIAAGVLAPFAMKALKPDAKIPRDTKNLFILIGVIALITLGSTVNDGLK